MEIEGIIIKGQGHASKNYPALIEQLAGEYPPIAGCGNYGTINIELKQPFPKRLAHHWTKQITWNPVGGLPSGRKEGFGFVKITFRLVASRKSEDAWIVYPEGHPFSYGFDMIEIISSSYFNGLTPRAACIVGIDKMPDLPMPFWFGKIYNQS